MSKNNLLSAKILAERLSIARPTIYELMRKHSFPRPVKLGSRSLWLEDEVNAWVNSLAEARNG
jgi:prophage regulatory protein